MSFPNAPSWGQKISAGGVTAGTYVPYTGATGDVNLGTYKLIVHGVKADASDGVLIEASDGTDVGILGAGNTANVTWYGSHNFNGATANTLAVFGESKTLSSLAAGADGQVLRYNSSATAAHEYDYPDPYLRRSAVLVYDFVGGAAGFPSLVTNASGTGAVAGDAGVFYTSGNQLGVVQVLTGTTSTGTAAFYGPNNAKIYLNNGQTIYEARVLVAALSDGTDTYSVNSGFMVNFGSINTDGDIWFSYTHSENSGRWVGKTKASGSTTTVNSSVAVAANTWYNLKIVVDATNANVQFFVDGVSIGTSSSNIGAGTIARNICHMILKSAGTTSVASRMDYMKLRKDFTTAR